MILFEIFLQELQTNHQQTEDELAAVGTEKEHLNEQTTVNTDENIHRYAKQSFVFFRN